MNNKKKFTFRQLLSDRELSPEERRLVLEDLFVFGKQNRIPFLFRMGVLLVLSTVIATAGLLSDSAAVVIGAMLVAPLMTPVMAAAAAVVMGWQKRFYSALWLILAMGLGALLLSSLLTLLSPEIVFIPEQVLARTRPTYFDLLIALAAGAAGAYTITRKESNAIPGVAVAVALLPPLASAGILLTSGEYELATRAVVLFLTNLVAMVLAAALTFLAVGVSPASARKHSAAFIRNKLYLFLVLTLSISVPLWFYTDKVLFNPHYLAAKSEVLQNWLHENELELTDVDFKNDTRTLSFSFTGPRQPLNIGDLYDQIIANGKLKGETRPLSISYTWTRKVSAVYPQKGSTISELSQSSHASKQQLISSNWLWKLTQYDEKTAARSTSQQDYNLIFEANGKFMVKAHCGKWKGKYTFSGKAMDITMNRNTFSACRKDKVFAVFIDDLQRSSFAFIESGKLRITLAGSGGIMFFESD
ncbi:MAG: TIGR00341 family protein [Xanthomonadales bacterium]|nr:TIGR00341 family protein [Xanthomonadales bacterium]